MFLNVVALTLLDRVCSFNLCEPLWVLQQLRNCGIEREETKCINDLCQGNLFEV